MGSYNLDALFFSKDLPADDAYATFTFEYSSSPQFNKYDMGRTLSSPMYNMLKPWHILAWCVIFNVLPFCNDYLCVILLITQVFRLRIEFEGLHPVQCQFNEEFLVLKSADV